MDKKLSNIIKDKSSSITLELLIAVFAISILTIIFIMF